ncbi:MAG: zinc ribbon domain-containing protein [Desulfobacterales bacterium]|nr:zinc ribbon domain-containing protein [Desulfobacterales bacterium]
MPIYEYECEKCGTVEEALQKFSDNPLTTCKHCSGNLQRIISHSSFHLKGAGWYVTDYADKPQSTSTPSKKEDTKPKTNIDKSSKTTDKTP